MAKRVNPTDAMLKGAATPAQLRAAKIDAKSDAYVEAMTNRGTGPAPKSKAAQRAAARAAEASAAQDQEPAQAATQAEPVPIEPKPALAEPEQAEQAVAAEAPAPASEPEPASAHRAAGRPADYDDLQKVMFYMPASMIEQIDREVYERKFAGDKKFNRSMFVREVCAAALKLGE